MIRTRILDAAKAEGLSQRSLARRMGIDPSQISRVRHGQQNVGDRFIAGALRAFPDKTFADLFTVEDDPEPAEVD